MKSFYLILASLFFLNFNAQGQFMDDMEYPNGPPYGEWWVPAPIIGGGVGTIPGDGTTEAILDLGNKTEGEWGLKFWMYVPSNKEAYWNLQGEVPIGSGEFIVGNIFFNQDLASPGIGHIDDTALGDVYFHFPHDEWFQVVMNFDMTLGISEATWSLIIAGSNVLWEGTEFTNEAGEVPTSLGGIDFFSISTNTEYYIDTFNYVNEFLDGVYIPVPFTDDMESYTEGEGIYRNWWSTWGCGEELGCALESTSAQAHSGNLSGLVPGDGSTNVFLNLGNKIFSEWGLEFWMYVPSGKEAYWNLQGSIPVPVGSGEWIVGNIFFNQDLANPGIGLIDDTVLGEVNFNFPHDQWFRVVMNWDISLGVAAATWQFNVDGVDVIPAGTFFKNENGEAPTSLGGIDFYSISTDNELYLDDFLFVNEFIDTEPSPEPFTDDMEYENGQPLNDWWNSAILISEDQALSGAKSGKIPGDGTTESLLSFNNLTYSHWAAFFWLYIPSGNEAALNIEEFFPNENEAFMNLYFNKNQANPGVGVIENTENGNVTFSFPHDQWFSVAMIWDLDTNISESTWVFEVDENIILPLGTNFTNFAGEYPSQIAGLNFYSNSSNSALYIDDVMLDTIVLDTEYNSDLDFVIFPNPTNNVLNLEIDLPVKNIVIYNLQGRIVKDIFNLKSIDVSELTSGMYFIEVNTDSSKSVQKFIKN